MLAKQHHSSPFPSPSCFRPNGSSAALAGANRSSKVAPPLPAAPTLATSLYHTELGLFALTWSRSILGRSFHLHFALDEDDEDAVSTASFASLSSTPSFHLHIKPFIFWKRQGSKRLQIGGKIKNAHIFWDLSRAKFGSGPEPRSGFYIAIVIDGEMVLLVGDSQKEAYSKTKTKFPGAGTGSGAGQSMVLRREHVYGGKLYVTRATVGGRDRNISIDCRLAGDDPRLYFYVDNKRVLQVKHLKWKFRGNERIEIDGIPIHVSWDVHNWLFEDDEDGYALFMFKFEKQSFRDVEEDDYLNHLTARKAVNSCGFGFETKMMKKGLLRTARSSSSSSLSSASSSCSSVMEWASTEENELKGPPGFSLLVYAWKS
nr:GPI-anchored protein like [Ipomoea batatas]